ncbi:MAG: UDP-N-acetylmuramoyl-tripeptide--D-alanyl-D-alanine ligase [Parachlamydiales bacterium]|nr:UDP-N-acetylmuramoyl-tripeptide--D-alanyl-D-alanine ligase [Parachlamydiales bacterium]
MDKYVKQLLDMQATGYQIDSRLIERDNIFFALKGEKTDGHKYLNEIVLKGAKLAIVSKDFNEEIFGCKLLKVSDVLNFLQALAKQSLITSKAKKIAITGSFGKTTIKDFLFTLMQSDKFKVSKTFKNHNSQRGFPIAILNMEKDVDFLILEMAMDEKSEIEKLVNIAEPDIALISKLALFQESFENIEEVAFAKNEIFLSEKTKDKIINKEIENFKAFKNKKFITYSINDNKADFYLDVENKTFYEQGRKIKIFPKDVFEEKHLLENLLAAISVCRLIDMSLEDILKNFKNLKTPEMRYEKVFINGSLFIKDYYNSNPYTMIQAIKNMPKTTGKKIVVLGHMDYLKINKLQLHEDVLIEAKKNADHIICFGSFWRNFKDFEIFEDFENVANHLNQIKEKDDVILIKGPRVLKMEKIFDYIN